MKKILELKQNKDGVFEHTGEEEVKTSCNCGYCNRIITFSSEVEKKPHYKKGKPICVICRVMKGKYGKIIRNDKKKYIVDVLEKEKIEDERELEYVKEIGLASQNRTGTNTNNQN